MKALSWFYLLTLLLLPVTTSCRPRRTIPTGVIRGAGLYAAEGAEWSLWVEPDGAFSLEERVQDARTTFKWDWSPRPGWFIYLEDTKRYWTYDGGTNLNLHSKISEGWSFHDGSRAGRPIPDAVLRALPSTMQKTFRGSPESSH